MGSKKFTNNREKNVAVHTVPNIIKMKWDHPKRQKLDPFNTISRKQKLPIPPCKK